MSRSQYSRLYRFRSALFSAPRRPRHPLLRLALGVVGIGLLLALLFVGVFVGAAMLAGGLLWRLWARRNTPVVARNRDINGDFRVVGKAQLPMAH